MIPQPHVFTAEGLAKGGMYEGGAAPLIDLCNKVGVLSVMVKISDLVSGVDGAARINELKSKGLYVVGWDDFAAHPESRVNFDHFAFDACCAQIEGPTQRDAAIAFFKAGLAAGRPRGIVTTYASLENGQWTQVAATGATFCIVECYHADDLIHANIDRMLAQGVAYGIPAAVLYPVLGTWQGELPKDYSWQHWSRSFGLWRAEAFGIAQQSQPWFMAGRPYWHLYAATGIIHSEWATTYSPGDDGLTRMIAWMGNNHDQIRHALSVELIHETGIS